MTDEPDETEVAIMEATFNAVCRHGYADVTMQDIADEFGKSKSLLHYHYDTKEELFISFLEYLVDRFEDQLDEWVNVEGDPAKRLRAYIEWFIVEPNETDRASLHLALLEMRSQAQHNDRIREQFRRSDRMARSAFVSLIEDGQQSGVFDPAVDAEAVAQLSFVAMDGARARQVTLDEPGYSDAVAETLHTLLIDTLESQE